MSPAAAEALFSTQRLDMVFLSPETAAAAAAPVMGAPTFYATEFGAPPDPADIADLLVGLMTGPPPPGVDKSSVFPIGLALKGQPGFVGLAHMVVGFPTETTVFLGLLILAEAHQRKGLGKEFFAGVYDWARPQGIAFMRVRCKPQHAPAKAFLDKMGFVDLPDALSSGHQVWERKLPATED